MKIAVIILTFNEEKHIARCIQNAKKISNEIYIIDSYSTDNTKIIAEALGINTILREWPGNQAAQFNWALDNLDIQADWILRLDADEYLLDDLILEIKAKLNNIPSNINGIIFNRRLIFCDKWIKRGAYPNPFLRLFRKGFGRSDNRIMDEHIVLSSGESQMFVHDFVDHNLMDIDIWFKKHLDYSNREIIEHFRQIYFNEINNISSSKKVIYNRFPLFIRCVIFFFFRYILKGGFIEGKESFLWNFYQGLWYRLLIDYKIWRIQKNYSKMEIISIVKLGEKFK